VGPQLKQLAKAYIRALKLPLTRCRRFYHGNNAKIWLWWEARSALETMQTATIQIPLLGLLIQWWIKENFLADIIAVDRKSYYNNKNT
jgi:hypothetical protein